MTDEQQKRAPWPFRWLENESYDAWFSWIEWLGLTAALITGALKASSWLIAAPIAVLALISIVLVFACGIASFTTFLSVRLKKLELPAYIVPVISTSVGLAISCAVLWSMVAVLLSLLQNGAPQ